jgi:hypothetical protein
MAEANAAVNDLAQAKAKKSISGLPVRWQNFLISLTLHLGLPLLPLGLERWFSGHVEVKSVALTAALYSMAIGLSSRSVGLFGLGVLMCVAFSAAFGFLSKQPELASADIFSYIAIFFIFTCHAIERYNRHVVDEAPFFEFLDR